MLFVLFMLTLILIFLYVWYLVLDGFKFKDLDELYNWNLYRYMQSIDLFFKKDIEFANFYRKSVRPALLKRERREASTRLLDSIDEGYIKAASQGWEYFFFSYEADRFNQEEVTSAIIEAIDCEKDDILFYNRRSVLGVKLESCKVILRDLD